MFATKDKIFPQSVLWRPAYEVIDDLRVDQAPLARALISLLSYVGVDNKHFFTPDMVTSPPHLPSPYIHRMLQYANMEVRSHPDPYVPIDIQEHHPHDSLSGFMLSHSWLRHRPPPHGPAAPPLPMATIPEAEVKKLVSRPQKIHVVPIKGYSALVYRDQTGEAHLGFQYLVQDSPVPEGSTGEAIACIIALKDHSSIQALPNDLLPFHYPNSHGDRLFLLPCVETEISIWDAEENDDDIEFLPMRELMNLDPPLAPGLPDLRDAIINIFADPILTSRVH